MPKQRTKEAFAGRYFSWLLGKRNGLYFADGRSNSTHDVGRHSLGTRNKEEAIQQLTRLDLVKAVEYGLADRALLNAEPEEMLTLAEGKKAYLNHVQRPPVLGGAGKTTIKRYKTVFDKFIPFAESEGVRHWQRVNKRLLEAYGAWLDDQDYAAASEYLELTTLKQAMKWLAEESLISPACLFALHLEKPRGTTTYCYNRAEVDAMIAHCSARSDLSWLGEVLVALITTGLRISELASLQWDDFDFPANLIRLTDARNRAVKTDRDRARSTKSHRDRSLPMRAELRTLLQNKLRHADGRVFHGPLGGILKPDTLRQILIREVLQPLATRFPSSKGKKGFIDGRLHSFRHYFCSMSATNNVPEQILMSWLGHQDSKMVRHYYHLHDGPSQDHMKRTEFFTAPPG